jgi:hypothetical protein
MGAQDLAYGACSLDAQHGTQMYVMEDTDGFAYVLMDPVAVADYAEVTMSGWVYTSPAAWNDHDLTRVWAVDGGAGGELELLLRRDVDSHAPSSQRGEGAWLELRAGLAGFTTTAVMAFGVQSDSAAKVRQECSLL